MHREGGMEERGGNVRVRLRERLGNMGKRCWGSKVAVGRESQEGMGESGWVGYRTFQYCFQYGILLLNAHFHSADGKRM